MALGHFSLDLKRMSIVKGSVLRGLRGFEFGFENSSREWFKQKPKKPPCCCSFAPPSLMLLFCVPANVSELPFSVSQTINRLSGYEQQQGR